PPAGRAIMGAGCDGHARAPGAAEERQRRGCDAIGMRYAARRIGSHPLCPARLLALERAEARTIGLFVEKLLHALAAAVFLVDEAQRLALGVEVVGRLGLVHEAHRAQRLLGVTQDGRALFHQLLGELDRLIPPLWPWRR